MMVDKVFKEQLEMDIISKADPASNFRSNEFSFLAHMAVFRMNNDHN